MTNLLKPKPVRRLTIPLTEDEYRKLGVEAATLGTSRVRLARDRVLPKEATAEELSPQHLDA